ncbi:MAG: ABC transporter permease [Flavobacteriales bacterium]|nr:ABC transporter permease [Flavobacteriales bacterium]
MNNIGIGSLGIVCIISIFMGAVVTIQTATNIESSWIPKYLVGYTARQTIVLEFSSTMIGLILAGKVGSSIAAELGNMRISEQIDALEIMGINSASYLILPKIVAAMVTFPLLMFFSMFLGIGGAWVIGEATGLVFTADFQYGLLYDFDPFSVTYATIKMFFFSFAISSIPAYQGYYVTGGSIGVGKAGTRAVVNSQIAILILNYGLTQLLLMS